MATAAQKANIARFKAVQTEAKKLKAKNKHLTHIQAVKQAWAIFYSKEKKSGPKKKAAKKIGQYDLFGEKSTPKKKVSKKKAAPKKVAHKKATSKKLKYVGVKKTASGASRYEYKLAGIGSNIIDKLKKVEEDIILQNKIYNDYKNAKLWAVRTKNKPAYQQYINDLKRVNNYIKELKQHKAELKKLL
jgi:hypothetical protein